MSTVRCAARAWCKDWSISGLVTKRLETIGQRPINNVADSQTTSPRAGQPLHAFDFEKLGGRRIVVRRATPGEKLTTLDGVERTLTNDMLVIADAEKPVALAGIMGGEDSEISTETADVLIESAYFDPHSVRQTARQLAMDTEASRRFERGADIEGVLQAQQRCVELICELAGGVATEDAVDVYPKPLQQRVVGIRPQRVRRSRRCPLRWKDQWNTRKLGFEPVGESVVEQDQVPSWRMTSSRKRISSRKSHAIQVTT